MTSIEFVRRVREKYPDAEVGCNWNAIESFLTEHADDEMLRELSREQDLDETETVEAYFEK